MLVFPLWAFSMCVFFFVGCWFFRAVSFIFYFISGEWFARFGFLYLLVGLFNLLSLWFWLLRVGFGGSFFFLCFPCVWCLLVCFLFWFCLVSVEFGLPLVFFGKVSSGCLYCLVLLSLRVFLSGCLFLLLTRSLSGFAFLVFSLSGLEFCLIRFLFCSFFLFCLVRCLRACAGLGVFAVVGWSCSFLSLVLFVCWMFCFMLVVV